MGAEDVLKRKSGVIYGEDVYNLFKYAQKNKFAIPAINVTSSSTVVAALGAAREKKSPIILQMSNGGSAFFCGKDISNKDQDASFKGAIAGAQYIKSLAPVYGIPVILHTDHCGRKILPWLNKMLEYEEEYKKKHNEPLFSSHMVDLSEEEVEWNIKKTEEYMEKAKNLNQFLEMEIGITGGEEDGVKSGNKDKLSMFTTPTVVEEIYTKLSAISRYFTIAAGFGNVHGVYKPGNVDLEPERLKKHQEYVKEQRLKKQQKNIEEHPEVEKDKDVEDDKPVFLVFHGGSGSKDNDYTEAISYGVVKVNLDTDLQYAYLEGIRDYILKKKDYLMAQVGNPDGEDEPNKSYYDPRVWVRKGEETMKAKIEEALVKFNAKDSLSSLAPSYILPPSPPKKETPLEKEALSECT